MDKSDTSLITATGSYGTFTWELPEHAKAQLVDIQSRLSEESAKETLEALRDDTKETVELLLLLISTAFLAGGSKSFEIMQMTQRKLGEALTEAMRRKPNE